MHGIKQGVLLSFHDSSKSIRAYALRMIVGSPGFRPGSLASSNEIRRALGFKSTAAL